MIPAFDREMFAEHVAQLTRSLPCGVVATFSKQLRNPPPQTTGECEHIARMLRDQLPRH